ncbi:hypothetical protein D3C86_985980 [compost metagenome]
MIGLDAAVLLQGDLGFTEQIVDRRAQLMGHVGRHLAQLHEASAEAIEHGIEGVDHRQQFQRRTLAVEALAEVAHADALCMLGHAPHRQQAALHQHVAGQCQQNRRHAGEQINVEPVIGEHRRALGHQAPGDHFQGALVARVYGRRQCRKRHPVDVGQVMHVAKAQRVIERHRRQRWHAQVARIDHQQRCLARRADGQQGFAITQHVLEQRRFGPNQLQGIAIVEERAQLIDAGNQGGIVAPDQFVLQVVVQRHAQCGQRNKREKRKHQRQMQRQGMAQTGQAVHGCVSKR